MRKLINVFIVILFVLTLTVKADSGGPMFPVLKADLKNDAKCYDDYEMKTPSKTTFKKGETIQVRYVDGKRFELVGEDIDYCYVNANDLIIGKNKYELTKDDRLDTSLNLLVVNPEGVQMYSGPHEDYEKIDMIIPKDTNIKTHYAVGTYWYYVTYNDVSGFISSMKNAIVHKEDIDEGYEKRYAIDDMDITDINGKKIGTLPAKTEVSDYWSTDETRQMYITYNDITGFVPGFYTFAYDCTGTTVKPLSSAPVYGYVTIDSEKHPMKKISTAEGNKTYPVKYCYTSQGETAFYIDSLNGWLYFLYDDKIDYIETNKNGEVFDSREYKAKHLLEIIEVEGYNLYFEKNVYSYNLEIGENVDKLNIKFQPDRDDGVKVSIIGNENLKNNSKITIQVADDDGDRTYTITVTKRSSTPVAPQEPTTEDKNSEIIWICLGACLLIVVTTIVIIILVNKKKKNKEVKEEINVIPSSNVEASKEETSEKKELEEDSKNELED